MKFLKEDTKKNKGTSQSPILQAVHEKNVETLNTNIALGFDVNICYSNSMPALFEACESSEMLEVFLNQPNIDVNIKNKNGSTALIYSCAKGLTHAVLRLCQDPRVSVNHTNKKGRSALMIAVSHNKPECVRILKTIPSVMWNLKDNDGRSALKLAVKFGRADCLEILLKVPGIDLSIISKRGRNIAQSLVENLDYIRTIKYGCLFEHDHFRCLELLSKDPRIDWNAKNKSRFTAREFLWNRTDLTFSKKERLKIMENISTAARNAARNPTSDVPAPKWPLSTAKKGFSNNLEVFLRHIVIG